MSGSEFGVTRKWNLVENLGLYAERALLSAGNGHSPWWNAGASGWGTARPVVRVGG